MKATGREETERVNGCPADPSASGMEENMGHTIELPPVP